ncbi:hypothetical protein KFZ70_02935 [Tamlana fucoidanivorans]|uniref:Uncharacterized protein n=1 Tax=Allotamlana fucoidanivorans TaxID=2583814 RepID=A0A5C4SEA9_9FLAO|nr:hypothetical protein [Tamlana fucoidanivorans]TNJ41935.1 hypothetical protein FGF67_15365 [Tamlana fucoidanivorans]
MRKSTLNNVLFGYLFLLVLLTLIYRCSNNTEEKLDDCGCESENIDSVPSKNFSEVPIEEQTSGLLFFKRPENVDYVFDDKHDGQYNNRFWIFQGVNGCNNCQRKFAVCNEGYLGREYDFLKVSNDSIPVRFRGDLKFLCVEPFITPADYFYSEIKLTLIERP